MAPQRIVLMSCGSYNPPTNMHLRMFEVARDHLHRMGPYIVVGGIISPVHDGYNKKDLVSSLHRCVMLRLALQNSDWIRLSTWETKQNCWTKTRISLQYHQNLLNSVLLDVNEVTHQLHLEDMEWIPENIRNNLDCTPIKIKLLCGADLLESFGTPGLWMEEDIEAILSQHGLVVITREGTNPHKFIYDSDILSKHMHNIITVTEWIPNEISSTRIRRALKRGESVRYLMQDSVIDYVYQNKIYNAKTTTTLIKFKLTLPNANNYLTIISPNNPSVFLTTPPSKLVTDSSRSTEQSAVNVSEKLALNKNTYNNTLVTMAALTRRSRPAFTYSQFVLASTSSLTSAINTADNITSTKLAAYPGQAKQVAVNESDESQVLYKALMTAIVPHTGDFEQGCHGDKPSNQVLCAYISIGHLLRTVFCKQAF